MARQGITLEITKPSSANIHGHVATCNPLCPILSLFSFGVVGRCSEIDCASLRSEAQPVLPRRQLVHCLTRTRALPWPDDSLFSSTCFVSALSRGTERAATAPPNRCPAYLLVMDGNKRQQPSATARYIRSLDAFSRMMKVPEDLRTQSTTGGAISLISLSIIAVLFFSELMSFLTPIRTTSLSVDTGKDELLQIHLDIDFPHVNCEILGVDALDEGGTMRLEINNNLYKRSIDVHGRHIADQSFTKLTRQHQNVTSRTSPSPSPWPNGCGSCMGAQQSKNECCNTCDDVRKAYEKRGWLLTDMKTVPQCAREGVTSLTAGSYDPTHGCNVVGDIAISKVAGRIHITPGHSFSFAGHTLHDFTALRNKELDLSHTIHRLSFGAAYPGQANPLDKTRRVAETKEQRVGQHEYFIRVVPTTYRLTFRREVRTNQYSQTYFFRHSDPNRGDKLLPGVFLNYDLSPIHVEVTESRPSFFHFVVQLCAIIGGVFTVAGMVSTFMDDVVLKAVRKRQQGKLI